MTPRGERIRESADALCRGKRYEAADRHVDAMRTAESIVGQPKSRDRYSDAFHDFLAGWDAALDLQHNELLDENVTLHGIVLDLCARLHVRRCTECKGTGLVYGTLDNCPHCDSGWVDIKEPTP